MASNLLFTAGLRTTPAAAAATRTLAEPFTATLPAVAVVGARPAPTA